MKTFVKAGFAALAAALLVGGCATGPYYDSYGYGGYDRGYGYSDYPYGPSVGFSYTERSGHRGDGRWRDRDDRDHRDWDRDHNRDNDRDRGNWRDQGGRDNDFRRDNGQNSGG